MRYVCFNKISSNRKEPKPRFIISAPAPGGNLISAPRLSAPAPQHWAKDNIFAEMLLIPIYFTKKTAVLGDNLDRPAL
jgi:hypothetical protein